MRTAAGLTVQLAAPAKINLTLRVLRRRADGYHELDAPTVPLDLADTVSVTTRADRRIVNDWRLPGVAPAAELGRRAARLLAQRAGVTAGVTIHITKRIPAGAGLGGGSSDAAAVLLACKRLWSLRWSLAQLAKLGGELGADVPFFVHCRQARLRGIGDVLEPLTQPVRGWCVLCVPRQRTATATVFARWQQQNLTNQGKRDKISSQAQATNDLVLPAMGLNPAIATTLRDLGAKVGEARMTGAGSACFAVLDHRQAAYAAARRLARSDIDVVVTRIMCGRRRILGSGQAVRQRILVPSCVGSNPTSPASSLRP